MPPKKWVAPQKSAASSSSSSTPSSSSSSSSAASPWQIALIKANVKPESLHKIIPQDGSQEITEVPSATARFGYSAFPHLSHEFKGRPEHVTDVRKVGTVQHTVDLVDGTRETRTMHVLERFHQDNSANARAMHDRYLVVDPAHGTVFNVTPAWKPEDKNLHIPRRVKEDGYKRGREIDTETNTYLDFTVNGQDDKTPPLSPRTVAREVPDQGYQK